MYTNKLVPGQKLPVIKKALVGAGEVELGATDGVKHKLLVVYRGQFCPFCLGTLKDHLLVKLNDMAANGIELLCVSADPLDVATKYAADHLLTFPIAAGLTFDEMKTLGVYVSDPKDYQPQDFPFAEPAYFFLKPDGTIQYADVSSYPAGAYPFFM